MKLLQFMQTCGNTQWFNTLRVKVKVKVLVLDDKLNAITSVLQQKSDGDIKLLTLSFHL